jgi:hypothetical protein
MNWARRLRWKVAAPAVAALAALAAAALPAAARTAGTAAPQQGLFVAPLAGATPAVALWRDPLFEGFMYDYTGSDRHVYQVFPRPTGEESLGGTLVGGPGLAFVAPPPGLGAVLFARGTNNAMYQFTGTSWQSLGGVLTSRPGVAAGALSVTGGEAIDAVVRGSDGAVWDKELTTVAGPWRGLGGRVLSGSGPAAVNVGGTLYVLAIGTDGAVWVRHSTDGAHWSGWQSLGGRGSGDVGAASPAPGVGVVFVRGTDNAVWYNEFAGTTAGVTPGWHSLGGKLTSGVGAGAGPDGTTAVLVLGLDNHIYGRIGTWPALGPWNMPF